MTPLDVARGNTQPPSSAVRLLLLLPWNKEGILEV